MGSLLLVRWPLGLAGAHEIDGGGSGGVLRTVVRLIGVAGLLALLVYSLVGGERPLDEGVPAPPVEGLRRLDGSLGSLQLAQGRPIVVNIWATWCPPCLQELPMFATAAKSYGSAVGFYGLAVDSNRDQMKQLVARMGITYDVAEIDGATSHAWNATALPSTYIVDGRGRIRWSVRGAIDRETLDEHLAPLLAP